MHNLLVQSPCLELLSLRNLGLTDAYGLSMVRALAAPPANNQQVKLLELRCNPGVTRLTYDAMLAARLCLCFTNEPVGSPRRD
jgi:hypothetical protein